MEPGIKTVGASPLGRAMMIRKNKLRNSTFFRRKPKRDVIGGVANDTPGSVSELNAKLDEILFARGDYYNKAVEKSLRGIAASNPDNPLIAALLPRLVAKIPPPPRDPLLPRLKAGTVKPSELAQKLNLMRKLSSNLDEILLAADPRPRNRLGEFAGQEEGVADPNSMAKTYRTGISTVQAGGAAVLGGAGGAAGSSLWKSLAKRVTAARLKLKK